MIKVHNLRWGLFGYKWYCIGHHLKDLREFFYRVKFTLQHGYSPVAQWECFAWMSSIAEEILTNLKDNRLGNPYIEDTPYKEFIENKTSEEIDEILTQHWSEQLERMIYLAQLMQECNPIYNNLDYDEVFAMQENAKEEFFELLSKYFWNLWD